MVGLMAYGNLNSLEIFALSSKSEEELEKIFISKSKIPFVYEGAEDKNEGHMTTADPTNEELI